ncbi:MAG: glycosyltransferase family 2 protein [Flavihumibacter sp.]
MTIVNVLLLILFCGLATQVVFLFILAIAGRSRNNNYPSSSDTSRHYLLILPCYKDDSVIVESVDAALAVDYPANKKKVLVIADNLQESTIAQLRQKAGVQVVVVKFEKSTKSKSLKTVLGQLEADKEQYDIAVILDADNIIMPDSIRKLNAAFDKGYKAAQLHRKAKNKNTPIAILDAISEELNNHFFRKGARNIGGSCALIGSGMAFEYPVLQSIMRTPGIEDNPGEDKEMEHILLKSGLVCEYINNGYVLDEKVQSTAVLEKQRTRWISAQLLLAKKTFIDEFGDLFTTNWQYFLKSFQYLLVPRVLLLFFLNFLAVVFIVVAAFGWNGHPVQWYWWLTLALFYDITLLLAIPREYYNKSLAKALLALPGSIFAIMKASLKSKAKQREFIHTVKTYNGDIPSNIQ